MEHLCSWLNVFRVETSQHSIFNFYMDLWIIGFVFLSWIDRISNWKRFARKGLTHMFRVETSQHSICNFYMDLWMIRFVFLIWYFGPPSSFFSFFFKEMLCIWTCSRGPVCLQVGLIMKLVYSQGSNVQIFRWSNLQIFKCSNGLIGFITKSG